MAIEQNKGELAGIESNSSSAFQNELHTERFDKMTPEAQRFAEMLKENEMMVEQIKAHAFAVADNVSTSLDRLPASVQQDFIEKISQYNDPHDLVYARVRQNYENKNLV